MSQTKAISQVNLSASQIQSDPEVVERAQRRQFSMAEKQCILAEADACQEVGAIGALLRREGIYSSYLTQWRRGREAGLFGGKAGAKRGRPRQAEGSEAAHLRQENEQLKAQLAQAELIITAQKNLRKP